MALSDSGWLVDGVALDDPLERWLVEWETMVPAPGAQRVAQLELPTRNGVIAKRQGWGVGSVDLSLGVLPTARVSVAENAQTLVALLASARIVSRRVGDLVVSGAVVSSVVEAPERLSTEEAWVVKCTLTVQPFWWADDVMTSQGRRIPGTVEFIEWADTTGPIQDAIVRVGGPCSVVLIEGSNGSGASFQADLAKGEFVFIDVARFVAWQGTGTDWEPTDQPVFLDYPPGGPLVLFPTSSGVALTVSGGGFTLDSSVSIRGRRWWL